MWTNVFRIGNLNHISWFQFIPNESDLNTLPDKSTKLEQKDAATWLVLWSHLQLQKDGFLSTWTNSFVGPWDPSQGLHNPDEKIKLWLFLPGHHSSVVERAQAAVSRLRVVASGVWVAPGDSEEVAAALSQSLRNCIEKALVGLSYMRFGDVFSKYHQSQSEGLFRRQPTVEFIFAATEEAIFVHVIISAKHIRALSSGDIERVLNHSSNSSGYRLPVIVSPHGMRGWLTGYFPSDLVKQVYFSSGKFRTSNGFIGVPCHVSQGPGCMLRGQNCYVEVTLGCPRTESEKGLRSNSNSIRNLPKIHVVESPAVGRGDYKGSLDYPSAHEKTFIYPAEAVVVPVLHTSYARSSLKRFWLQNWIGPSLPASSFFMHCGGDIDNMEGSWIESNGVRMRHGCNSSSNSNSSSIGSLSSSSSDSDPKRTGEAGDLEADADSLSCRQSGLSSNDQMEIDGPKLGTKRPRTGMPESFGQMGAMKNNLMQDAYKSDFGSLEISNSAITGVANEQIGTHLDWDDDDRGIGINIQALLSEFGDFDDFFQNDVLPFGEPPGTAESQALMFSAPDCGEVVSSPIGVMDVADQMLLPVSFPSFESFNPPPAEAIDECVSKNRESTLEPLTSCPVQHTPPSSTGEFEHLIKAEALMSFAPEYGAVETQTSELSSSIFRSPYYPKSRKVESSNSSPNNYRYGATPPSSPCIDGSDEKTSMTVNPKAGTARVDTKKYYTHVESGKEQHDRKLFTQTDSIATSDGIVPSSFSTFDSTNAVKSVLKKMTESAVGSESFILSMKTVLATEVESLMFQAYMCRVRHILLSSSNPASVSLSRLSSSSVLGDLPGEGSTMTDNISSRYEVKKKESIPVRIAGDFDGGVLDGHLNAPVGVWRSVAVPKLTKPSNSPSIEVSTSLPHHSLNDERMFSYKHRQPLQELLDGMSLLVQQATSFVDVALDADCGDGPYGWLALQEHWRRGFSCGPSMVHAGCGGTLASCHSLDVAGMQLVDPLSSDIHAPSVISLLQSEIKTALKSAFGNLDGPLSVTDWCRGRGQSGDGVSTVDGSYAESMLSECKDSSSTVCLSVGEPMSPAQSSAGASSCLKVDGAKADDTGQRRLSQEIESEQLSSSRRPTVFVLPSPAVLVGYQDDWLKTPASSLQLWEKAPFEPYASPKPITYCVICPDIDPLTSAAADFFQQLGTVYETCKLGTHQPQSLGNQMEIDTGKLSYSGFVLLDCPQSMKIESSNTSLVGSISDYFLSLSNGWDMTSYLKSLSKAVKALKIGPCLSTNPKEGNTGPCMVIYVVCPFPEPIAVLQTVIESSVAVGSTFLSSDRERRQALLSQVGKALSCSAVVDEASPSNVLVLAGFSVPKLVLQIVTVDAIFRVASPALNELVILKETAFTVYNKARRISKGFSNDVQSSTLSGRSHSVIPQMNSIPAMWKDCVGPRLGGPTLPREGEMDAGLRSGSWDNSWQTARGGGLSCDPSRNGDLVLQDECRYLFEPLFILAEPGSLEHAAAPAIFCNLTAESSKLLSDDSSGGFMQSSSSAVSADTGSSSQLDGSEPDGLGGGYQKTLPGLHCCYGWTEDWRWLVCIWTDARGELLDSHIFPFGGISSRQDTKGLQCLFVQVLQQGCQILQACSSPDIAAAKPRDFVITRIGNFFELEYLEWQKAIYSVAGSEVKKWPLQLRRSMPDGMPASSNGANLQQQEMSLMQERNLPSSPSPLYSSHSKGSGFMKGGLGQSSGRKQLIGGHTVVDNSRGMLQWVQSISFATISIDHSLNLVFQADSPSPGGTQGGSGVGASGYLEGFTPVKSLGSTSASYILIPSPSMRFLPPTPLQLPTCLTAESPPLAHLLHSKGSAIPLSTGFVVSKAVPSMGKDYRSNSREEWPSVLSVSLIDYYGGTNIAQEKLSRGTGKQGVRTLSSEVRDYEIEIHLILESIAAELHALSWMTVSPAHLERRTALPFHCDMVLRLRRLLHFADKELSSQPDKSQL
ncbi:mediator of RNA polymerase II transcription subunit 13 isoform X2 [Ricinus communis]|uniref:mediator of RNA polymerase II transcription subunit 13 isoform X2 n=1 Tax=Ricinus communis TaxID=3988 RepID=UPI00201ABBE4|nr:mediator of RNA polymerase II transcription subunit 13 isoform X2 [Ricinus communis]